MGYNEVSFDGVLFNGNQNISASKAESSEYLNTIFGQEQEAVQEDPGKKENDPITEIALKSGMTREQLGGALRYIIRTYPNCYVARARFDQDANVLTFIVVDKKGKETLVQYQNGKLLDSMGQFRVAAKAVGVDDKTISKIEAFINENYKDIIERMEVKKDVNAGVVSVVIYNSFGDKDTIRYKVGDKKAAIYRGSTAFEQDLSGLKDIAFRSNCEKRLQMESECLVNITKVKVINQTTVRVYHGDTGTESGQYYMYDDRVEEWTADGKTRLVSGKLIQEDVKTKERIDITGSQYEN